METFAIFLGGDLTPSPRLLQMIKGVRAVAADSGMRHAQTLNVTPELWVGDFDSTDAVLVNQFTHVERLAFSRDKDMTDGEIAIEQALARGAEKIILIGAFGGKRTEHEFCHFAQAVNLAKTGTKVEILDGVKQAHPIPLKTSLTLNFEVGTSFSILGFSDLTGLTIEGAKWPLHQVNVPFGSSLILSNEVAGLLTVSLESGAALLLAHVNI